MEKKNTLTLDKEFILYCELNNIKDIDKVAKEAFSKGFAILKYGETPVGNTTVKEKIVEVEIIKEVPVEIIVEKEIKVPYEVEKIKEIIKEVPVEVIKEVIKEVPVEVIKEGKTKTKTIEIIKEVVKEVPVEKIVEITKEVVNTEEIDRLKKENEKLKKELDDINNSLNKLNKATYMKNSNLGSLYDE
jgi:valyl-tRNA synthetase